MDREKEREKEGERVRESGREYLVPKKCVKMIRKSMIVVS